MPKVARVIIGGDRVVFDPPVTFGDGKTHAEFEVVRKFGRTYFKAVTTGRVYLIPDYEKRNKNIFHPKRV